MSSIQKKILISGVPFKRGSTVYTYIASYSFFHSCGKNMVAFTTAAKKAVKEGLGMRLTCTCVVAL